MSYHVAAVTCQLDSLSTMGFDNTSYSVGKLAALLSDCRSIFAGRRPIPLFGNYSCPIALNAFILVSRQCQILGFIYSFPIFTFSFLLYPSDWPPHETDVLRWRYEWTRCVSSGPVHFQLRSSSPKTPFINFSVEILTSLRENPFIFS